MIKHSRRVYKLEETCSFSSTKSEFGGLSNMCAGFNLNVNGKDILTSEALYQALRFPNNPEIQIEIVLEKSPMTAKMVSKKYIEKTRDDWENVKIDIMRWCLRVKLAQNFLKFGLLLEKTGLKNIVELSNKDEFWGARLNKNTNSIIGVNALGRLLMELRAEYLSESRYSLLTVKPLIIEDFRLFGEDIPIIYGIDNIIEHITVANKRS